jgi:AraC-like DNA-binding protein
MKPQLPTSLNTASLAEAARAIHAAHVFVVSALPGGSLRTVQASSPSASMNRLYSSAGQYVDAPTWDALFTGQAVHAADYFAARPEARQEFHGRWLGRLGYAHAISAPLNSPVIAGFPGAIIALGSMGQPAFSDVGVQTLARIAQTFSDESVTRIEPRASRTRTASNRMFVFTENGKPKGANPHDSLDSVLAGHVEAYARSRLAQEKPTSAGDRVLLLDARSEAQAFTVSLYDSYPAIAPGRVLVLAAVPHFKEWLELTPADFTADAEIGRLLPAFRFMHEHFHDGATLPTIASHVHLSPFHFHRRFTELLGITPKHFLFDCQIAKAQELLLEASHELEAIAKLCGFAHQSHFTSRFKQATGLTPTRWRKLHLSRSRDETSLERAHAL